MGNVKRYVVSVGYCDAGSLLHRLDRVECIKGTLVDLTDYEAIAAESDRYRMERDRYRMAWNAMYENIVHNPSLNTRARLITLAVQWDETLK